MSAAAPVRRTSPRPSSARSPDAPRAPGAMNRLFRAALPLAVGAGLALIPAPAGLAPTAWLYFAVFAAAILALVTEPVPGAVVGLVAVTLIAVAGLAFTPAQLADPEFRRPAEAIKWALAGFANSSVWLIFSAFMFAMG